MYELEEVCSSGTCTASKDRVTAPLQRLHPALVCLAAAPAMQAVRRSGTGAFLTQMRRMPDSCTGQQQLQHPLTLPWGRCRWVPSHAASTLRPGMLTVSAARQSASMPFSEPHQDMTDRIRHHCSTTAVMRGSRAC